MWFLVAIVTVFVIVIVIEPPLDGSTVTTLAAVKPEEEEEEEAARVTCWREAVETKHAAEDSSTVEMSRKLNGIVAVCPDLGIGRNGNLPWHPVRLKWVALTDGSVETIKKLECEVQ